MNELARLKWQCRRGMLELDLLLEQYLDTRYHLASESEKATFLELLTLEDDVLLAVLLDKIKFQPNIIFSIS